MLRIVILLAALCASAGCAATSKAKPDAATPLKREPVRVSIISDRDLNRFENNAHSLFLCLYQLKEPEPFSRLARQKKGISKLMECRRFHPTVLTATQFVVQPGRDLQEIGDMADGVRYLGVAAGYYGLGREKVTELAPLAPGKDGKASANAVRIDLGVYHLKSVKVQ